MKGSSLQRKHQPEVELMREHCPSHWVSLRRENEFCHGAAGGCQIASVLLCVSLLKGDKDPKPFGHWTAEGQASHYLACLYYYPATCLGTTSQEWTSLCHGSGIPEDAAKALSRICDQVFET